MNRRANRHPQTSRHPRGFTLIEVVVALSAGMLVSMAAFALSKSATSFFQHEARIANAQLALAIGVNRLTSDIQRASYLSTPNAARDPMVCRDAWPGGAGIHQLAGLRFQAGSFDASSQIGANGFQPDSVTIGGSLDTTEVFSIQCVLGSAAGASLQLQQPLYDNAMARVAASLGTNEMLAARLTAIFAPGRLVNIFDPATGYHYYAIIGTPVTVDNDGSCPACTPRVQLAATIALPAKPASRCGLPQLPQCGGGLQVSVVSRARYRIESLVTGITAYAGNPYEGMVTLSSLEAVTKDSGRTELTRVELDAEGAPIPGTLELVAEYAVDMRFGITVSPQIGVDNYEPSLTAYPITNPPDTHIYLDYGGDVSGGSARPQDIRSVLIRLSTRSRAPDREGRLLPNPGADGRRLHFKIDDNLRPGWARMRTAYFNVALPNQGGFSLW